MIAITVSVVAIEADENGVRSMRPVINATVSGRDENSEWQFHCAIPDVDPHAILAALANVQELLDAQMAELARTIAGIHHDATLN